MVFENCTTLEQLNSRRHELLQGGAEVCAVNAEYNRARRALMQTQQDFRRPPKFVCEAQEAPMLKPAPIYVGAPKNVLKITNDGIYI